MNNGSSDAEIALLQNYMFESSTGNPERLFNYGLRIKNLGSLDFVNQCEVPSAMQLKISDSNNEYVQKGIHLAEGDFYECVNSDMGIKNDFVLNFKFFFSKIPDKDYSLISYLVQNNQNSQIGTSTNGRLPVNFKALRLAILLTKDAKLKLMILGLPYLLTPVFEINKGYTVSLNFRRVEDWHRMGPQTYNRFLTVYVDGVIGTDSWTIKSDFGAVSDLTNSARLHYLYLGDYVYQGLNYYNFIFQYPNTINSQIVGGDSTDRSYTESEAFVFLQDVAGFRNTMLTSSADLMPSNCKLGVQNLDTCLICIDDYVLDSVFKCQKRSDLSALTIFTLNHDSFHECGIGLFFQTDLKICQNCPSGCAVCDSLSICTIKTSGCPANCARCDTANVCLSCSAGYSLHPTTKVCLQCLKSNCDVCPYNNLNTCSLCKSGMFFDANTVSCVNCNNCETCVNDKDFCLTCPTTRYLTETNDCLLLPDNIFKWKSTEITRKCFTACKTCDSSNYNKCTSCFTNFIAVYSEETVKANLKIHTCESICPDTHYIATTYQTVAGTYCLPCTTLIQDCEQCRVTNSNPICSFCLKGYYVTADAVNLFENKCSACDSSCETCAGSSDNCMTCPTGKTRVYKTATSKYSCDDVSLAQELTNKKCENHKYLYNGQCGEECPEGTFRRKQGFEDCTLCEKETSGCYDCDKVTSVCQNCNITSKSRGDNTCYYCNQNLDQCCDVGQGINDGACIACNPTNCADCYNKEYCISCNAGFVNTSRGQCQSSIGDCQVYNNLGDSCVQCNTDKSLVAGACQVGCPAANTFSYLKDASVTCEGCDPSCTTCTSVLENYFCSACAAGRILLNGACTECEQRDRCSVYTAGTCTCTTCIIPGDKLIGGVCHATCPEGYFDNVGTCVACAGCKVCSSATASACSGSPPECLEGFRLQVSGSLFGCCQEGEFFNGGSCGNCAANCKTCTSAAVTDCTEGSTGFFPNGAAISTCDGTLNTCSNTGIVLEFGESCKFGSKAYYIDGTSTWFGECYPASTVTDCTIAYFDVATTTDSCYQCDPTHSLSQTSPYTCEATCSTGVLTEISYKMLGQQFKGKVCLAELANCDTFNEFYFLGCQTCKVGYYLFKTGNLFEYFSNVTPVQAPKEITICGKCHPSCSECIDYSPYSCTMCNAPQVLFLKTCVDECPRGFTADAQRICQANTCSLEQYAFSGGPPNCLEKCPENYFADNSTLTCIQCNTACTSCWGPTGTDCRTCDESSGQYAFGDGNCQSCAGSTYPDALSAFTCSEMETVSYITPLTGVEVKDGAGAVQTVTPDADGYISIPIKDWTVLFPDFSYQDTTRTCFRYLIQFDLKLQGFNDWHGKKISVKNGAEVVQDIFINKWLFQDWTGSFTTTAPSNFYEKLYHKIYIDNNKCGVGTLTISICTDLAVDTLWMLKNAKLMFFKCPVDCLDCKNSTSCDQCEEGKFFYSDINKCALPYDDLKSDDFSVLTAETYLFKPKSFFLLFTKPMNFTLDDPQQYFFPSVVIESLVPQAATTTTTTRIIQELATTRTVAAANTKLFFRGNNLLEILIDDYLETSEVTAKLSFRYPLVDTERIAYNFTNISVSMIPNNPNRTLFDDYFQMVRDQESVFLGVFTALPLIFFNSLGGNWFFLNACQKMYLLLFINTQQSGDTQEMLEMMRFSFFSWLQKISELAFSSSEYWQKTQYEIYIGKDQKTVPLDQDFDKYIPPLRLSQFKIRKNFLINTDIVCIFYLVFVIFWILFKPVAWCLRKKYFYKANLLKNLDRIDSIFTFRFFVRYFLVTFAPLVFYSIGNYTFFSQEELATQVSSAVLVYFSGIMGLMLFCMCTSACCMPFPKQMDIQDPWILRRRYLAVPYDHYMVYMKNPDYLRREDIVDEDDDFNVASSKKNGQEEKKIIHYKENGPKYDAMSYSIVKGKVTSNKRQRAIKQEGAFAEEDSLLDEEVIGKGEQEEDEEIKGPKGGDGKKSVTIVEDPQVLKARIKKEQDKQKAKIARKKKGFISVRQMREDKKAEKDKDQRKLEREERKKKEREEREGGSEDDDDSEDDPEDEDDEDDEEEGEDDGEEGGEFGDDDEDDDLELEDADDVLKKQAKEGEEGEDDDTDDSSGSTSRDSDSSSDLDEKLDNIQDFGRLLGVTVLRMESRGRCCYCKCLRQNVCMMKLNNYLERTAKYYMIMRCLHVSLLAGLAWNMQKDPATHSLVSAIVQSVIMAWVTLARPYKSQFMNFFLFLTEILFTVFGWCTFMLTGTPSQENTELFYLANASSVFGIFIMGLFVFFIRFLGSLIMFCKSMGKNDE